MPGPGTRPRGPGTWPLAPLEDAETRMFGFGGCGGEAGPRTTPKPKDAAAPILAVVMPCVREHTFALGALAYSIVSEGVSCMSEHRYQWRPVVLCMLDGSTARNIVALVEIAVDVVKCCIKATDDSRRTSHSTRALPHPNCPDARHRALELAAALAANTKQVCAIINRELCSANKNTKEDWAPPAYP